MRQSRIPKEPFAADGTGAGTSDELLSGELRSGGITHPIMTVKQAGCIWGTFIGDALAMPVHWYYDRAALEECHRMFFTAYARGVAPKKCGSSDIHIGGLAHVGLLGAFFGTDFDSARAVVREHVALTHRAPEVLGAADAFVQILGAVFAGADLREAILEHGSDWFSRRMAGEWSREADEIVVGRRVSPACYIAEAFPASLYLAWKYADDFETGIIANTHLGGDNCHRGAVIGALLGAGAGRIPPRFRDGLQRGPAVEAQLESCVR